MLGPPPHFRTGETCKGSPPGAQSVLVTLLALTAKNYKSKMQPQTRSTGQLRSLQPPQRQLGSRDSATHRQAGSSVGPHVWGADYCRADYLYSI